MPGKLRFNTDGEPVHTYEFPVSDEFAERYANDPAFAESVRITLANSVLDASANFLADALGYPKPFPDSKP